MAFNQGTPGVGTFLSIVQVGIANPPPIPFFEIESHDYSIKTSKEDLRNGEGELIDSFVTQEDITGKLVLNANSAALIAAAVRGATASAGGTFGGMVMTTVPTTPFEVTVTPPNSGTFVGDNGVFNTTDNKKMVPGATATGTNVYAVGAAKYTFNTADAGDAITILYRYSLATGGTTAEIAQPTAGTAASRWAIHAYKTTIAGKEWGYYVPYASIDGLDESFKKGWGQTTINWTALPSATGKKFYRYGQS